MCFILKQMSLWFVVDDFNKYSFFYCLSIPAIITTVFVLYFEDTFI